MPACGDQFIRSTFSLSQEAKALNHSTVFKMLCVIDQYSIVAMFTVEIVSYTIGHMLKSSTDRWCIQKVYDRAMDV